MNSVEKRFWDKVVPSVNTDCLLWDGTISPGGYGGFQLNGKKQYAHRVSYEMYVEEIPYMYEVDHLCRTRDCVNPEHLEAVTSAENTRRAKIPIYRKTHCKWGHEFTDDNIYWEGNARKCKHCHANRSWKQITNKRYKYA
jgi:hypothetical protein